MSALVSAGHAAVVAWTAILWVLVHGTVLAVLAWALSETLLRRARPAVVAALWSVVLLKFLVPVGPAMPWSLSSLVDGVLGGGVRLGGFYALPDLAPASARVAHAPTLGVAGLAALTGVALWLTAVVVIAVRRVRHHAAARRQAAAAGPAPAALVATVHAVARRLGLGRTPDVRLSDDHAVPWVVGLRRPVLVVPAALAAGPADELAAVVGHELAHLRRRDAWLRLVQIVAGTLFFFWPVVRWTNRRIDAARELACDAWAIARGPLGAPAYARVLVRTARLARPPVAALGLAAHPRFLGRRVDALLGGRGGRPPRAGVGLGGVVLVAMWAVIALAGATRAEAGRAAPSARATTCTFTPELAAAILASYPEADIDGDGYLTRTEACDFQLEWAMLSTELPADQSLLVEGLCCNCGEIEDRCPQD